jgi:hypothetical protein
MRFILIALITVVVSCLGESRTTYRLTKAEAEVSHDYPIGLEIEFSKSFEKIHVQEPGKEGFWIVLKGTNSDLTIASLTDTNFSVSPKEFLLSEAKAVLESDPFAHIIGTTNERFGDFQIPFIHLKANKSIMVDDCNGYSIGILEYNQRQLQIHINEQLKSTQTPADFLSSDIREILNSIKLE